MSTLRGKITLNTKAFQSGIKRVKTMARNLGRELIDRFKTVGKTIAPAYFLRLKSGPRIYKLFGASQAPIF